jgi:hypothetical protein
MKCCRDLVKAPGEDGLLREQGAGHAEELCPLPGEDHHHPCLRPCDGQARERLFAKEIDGIRAHQHQSVFQGLP